MCPPSGDMQTLFLGKLSKFMQHRNFVHKQVQIWVQNSLNGTTWISQFLAALYVDLLGQRCMVTLNASTFSEDGMLEAWEFLFQNWTLLFEPLC
jgi:hypothetical protein